MCFRYCCAVIVLMFAAIGNVNAEDHELNWQQSDAGVLITEGVSKVLFYQRSATSKDGSHARAHYIHPLYDLAGRVLTEDFPADHLHHRGIFWAWHQLRIGDQVLGDAWELRRFRWDVPELTPQRHQDGSVELQILVHWKSADWHDGRDAAALENTSIRVYPSHNSTRRVDFDIQLRATEPGTMIGGSEDDKGYGGFSVRIKLPDDIRFHSSAGEVLPQKTAVDRSPWMTMQGSLGDPTPTDGSAESLTVLCHPDSAGYPQPWILREQRSMQNAVWPGRDAQPLATDQPTRLRYRLIIHPSPVTTETIQGWHQEYSQLP